LGTNKNQFDAFLAKYQDVQRKATEELELLAKQLNAQFANDFVVEQAAGKKLAEMEQQKRKLAERFISNPAWSIGVRDAAAQRVSHLAAQTKDFWHAALALANQGPQDPILAKKWQLEHHARSRGVMTQADLNAFYTRKDLALICQKTGLTVVDAQKLYDLIHQAFVSGIRQQSAERVLEKIAKQDFNSVIMALDVLAAPEIPGLNSPATVVLQHEENILLNKRQVTAFNELLAVPKNGKGFNNVVEKIVMGGGKSKVILPIVAEEKANGSNLVILEVPPALLETNYEDLNRVSQRLYGKRAYRFDFNRDSNSSPERLEQIYNQFVEIMTNKAYLVTTGEAMQSLELKYRELLLSTEAADETLNKKLYWLDKITHLVRHYGDCIIDEAHQGLSIKKRLNYTNAELESIEPETIANAISLFRLIDPQFIKEAQKLTESSYDWGAFKSDLLNKLINDSSSALHAFMNQAVHRYSPEITAELKAYLLGTATQSCPAVLEANATDQDMLAFFKEEFNLLPKTLMRSLNTNYGPSQKVKLSAIERTVALPYLANNLVNERSRYANPLESINYMAQMMLINGISEELMLDQMNQWQAIARQELYQNPQYKSIEETPTAKGFKLLADKSGFELSALDVNNFAQMQKVHAYFKHNQAMILNILEERALSLVKRDGETLSSNAFNRVDMYRSIQAISGTPSNYPTFHQRLTYNKASSLGSDGQIIQTLHEKNTHISYVEHTNLSALVASLLTNAQNPVQTRAIIDICAAFQGISNVQVAQEIASYYREQNNTKIRHVLYFNREQILCALDIHKPNKPIVLKTTDEKEIARLLDSAPDERFIYYDQAHTVGTDIKQADNAHALVLVDEKVPLPHFLQGCMRMRGLNQAQTVELMVSKNLKDKELSALIDHLEQVDKNDLYQDNLTAAKLKMFNLIRRQCLSIIQHLPSEQSEEKRRLASIFKSFLVDAPPGGFYELYGAINKKQATKTILNELKKNLLGSWSECLTHAAVEDANTQAIESEMQEIIDSAVLNCLQEYEAADNSFAKEIEVQAELQRETQLEVAAINDCFDPALTEAQLVPFPDSLTKLDTVEECKKEVLLPLNAFFDPDNDYWQESAAHVFSSTLTVTKNYAHVYQNQNKLLNAYLKPVFMIWYHMYEKKLQATIVTCHDAKIIESKIKNSQLTESWLSTTQDTLIAGSRPKSILKSEEYLSLREQIRFFNGEFAPLLHQDEPLMWIKNRTEEKLNVMTHSGLLSYRAGDPADFVTFKAVVLQGSTQGYAYIASRPFEDLTQFNWKKRYPRLLPTQVAEHKRVAEAFIFMNKAWISEDLSMSQLQTKFNLSLNSLEYINPHLTHLLMFKQIINRCAEVPEDEPFLLNLSEKEIEFLNVHFQVSVPELMEKYKATREEPNSEVWHKADSEVLLKLRSHPVACGTNSMDASIAPALIHKATTTADLQRVIKLNYQSEKLAHLIVFSPYCDHVILRELIDSQMPIAESTWQLLFNNEKHKVEDLIVLIARQPRTDLPSFVMDYMVLQKDISEEDLLKMADIAADEVFCYKIFTHTLATEAIKERLFNNPRFNAEKFLMYFINNNPEDVNGFLALLSRPAFSSESIEQVAVKIKDPQFLHALLSSDKATHNVLLKIIENPIFTPEVAAELVQHRAVSHEVVNRLVSTIDNIYKKTHEASLKAAWTNAFGTISQKLSEQGKLALLQRSVGIRNLHMDLTFKLLNTLGKEIINSLNLNALAHTNNKEIIRYLVDYKQTGPLPDTVIDFIASNSAAQESLDTFLERFDLSNDAIAFLLVEHKLSTAQLLQIASFPLDKINREELINHPAATDEVREQLTRLDTPEYLLTFLTPERYITKTDQINLLKNSPAVTSDVLKAMLQLPRLTKAVITQIIAHHNADDAVLREAISNEQIFLEHLQQISQRQNLNQQVTIALAECVWQFIQRFGRVDKKTPWHQTLIKALKELGPEITQTFLVKKREEKEINPKLCFILLGNLGKDILNVLPFVEMVQHSSSQEFDELLCSDVRYSHEQIIHLIARVEESAQISQLLNRSEMTAELGDVLFAKEHYNGQIKAWNWLTTKQLLTIAKTTDDVEVLFCALSHKNLSAKSIKTWFNEVKAQQEVMAKKANTLHESVLAEIEQIRILAFSHMLKAIEHKQYGDGNIEHYGESAKSAFKLYHYLRQETVNTFANTPPNLELFKRTCQGAIHNTEKVLGTHRGYKQAILDVLNKVLAFITRKPTTGEHWRFFEADTASLKKVRNLSQTVQNFKTPETPENEESSKGNKI
jgi:hypothetical protein